MSILPPNATALELAVEAATDRAIAVEIARLWDPDTCPEAILPWLADALSVDDWSPAWTAARKREVIRQSVEVHRRKGTRASLHRALNAAGYDGAVITEAWELPRLGRPYSLPGGVVPQMALDFRDGRYWAATGPAGVPGPVSIDALMTVDRAGPAWAWGPDRLLVEAPPHLPRIDHAPATGGRRGLMVERAGANLLLQSGALAAAPWVGSGGSVLTVIDNGAPGLDGTMTACRLVEGPATSWRGRIQTVSVVAGQRYVVSVPIRASAGRHCGLLINSTPSFGGIINAAFDLSTGTANAGGGGVAVEAGTLPLAGDWRLVWLTAEAIADGPANVEIRLTNSPTNPYASWAGDGESWTDIDTPQLETGSRPTSRIVSGAAQGTRAADRATVSLTGAPWWNAAEGSFLVHIAGVPADAQTRVIGGWSGGAFGAATIYITKGSDNAVTLNSGTGGGVFVQLLPPGSYTGEDLRVAFRHSGPGGAVAACLNGGAVRVDLSTTLGLAGVDRLRFGDSPWGSGGGTDGVVRIGAYYGRALTDDELRAVTTPGNDLVVPLIASRGRPLGRTWRLGLRDAHWADYTVGIAQQVTRADVDLLVDLLANTAPARCRLRRVSMAQGVRHVLGRDVWALGRNVPLGGVFNFEVSNG